MSEATLFAAKSNKDGAWECVPQHLEDTAAVMKSLCDPYGGWVSPAFIHACGIDSDVFERLCVFAAYVHDIGKYTPVFQSRIAWSLPGLSERLSAHGFDIHTEYPPAEFYHAFISGAILHEYYGVNDSVCEVVAAHHGIPRSNSPDQNWKKAFKYHKENVLGNNGEFKTVWDEAVKRAEDISGIKCSELPELSYPAQILLSGLLITADWVASNENYFPLTEPWDISGLDDPYRGERGFQASGIQRGWFPQVFVYDPEVFEEQFGFSPNAMQDMTARAAGSGAQLIFVEGVMGSGKTEAALASAELLAARNGSGGLYIGLPTQATSNGIFPRMTAWASKVSGDLSASVALAHGGAMFNDEYRRLQVNTADESRGNLSVNRWMSGRHRKLMPDFVDGTVDQALAAVLDQKYFMLLHEQLAGKVVVLDEVHSYDAYTNSYLETLLAYLGLYHCPTILLSATLTNEKKRDFLKAYSQNAEVPEELSDAYPCVTWWDGQTLHEESVPTDGVSSKPIRVEWLQTSQLAERIRNSLAGGGCAGVIKNTVKEAIKTYQTLKEELPDHRVILIHSRFLMDDRARLEDQIITLTGKHSTQQQREKLIVVGTQVLEQSLDLDFDVMFIDPCPMDLLFQRLGREHRHKRNRPDGLSEAAAYLLKDGDKIIGRNDRPYSSYIIDRTCELIEQKDGLLTLPDDIKPMIEQTYDLTLTGISPEKIVYEEQIRKLKTDSNQMRIREPWNSRTIRGLAQKETLNDMSEENYGVRQGDDSISVLLLKEKDGWITDIAETVSCRIGNLPDEETETMFLRQVIKIPAYMISFDELSRTKAKTGFGDERIWAYRNILLVDENGCYEHMTNSGTKCFMYDHDLGLTEVKNGRTGI